MAITDRNYNCRNEKNEGRRMSCFLFGNEQARGAGRSGAEWCWLQWCSGAAVQPVMSN